LLPDKLSLKLPKKTAILQHWGVPQPPSPTLPKSYALTPNIVPARGDGFSEDILQIVQHSLYLMCLSE
jgi:hypothetical protein